MHHKEHTSHSTITVLNVQLELSDCIVWLCFSGIEENCFYLFGTNRQIEEYTANVLLDMFASLVPCLKRIFYRRKKKMKSCTQRSSVPSVNTLTLGKKNFMVKYKNHLCNKCAITYRKAIQEKHSTETHFCSKAHENTWVKSHVCKKKFGQSNHFNKR